VHGEALAPGRTTRPTHPPLPDRLLESSRSAIECGARRMTCASHTESQRPRPGRLESGRARPSGPPTGSSTRGLKVETSTILMAAIRNNRRRLCLRAFYPRLHCRAHPQSFVPHASAALRPVRRHESPASRGFPVPLASPGRPPRLSLSRPPRLSLSRPPRLSLAAPARLLQHDPFGCCASSHVPPSPPPDSISHQPTALLPSKQAPLPRASLHSAQRPPTDARPPFCLATKLR